MHSTPAHMPRPPGHGVPSAEGIANPAICQRVTPQRGRRPGIAAFRAFPGHKPDMDGGPPTYPRQTGCPLPQRLPRSPRPASPRPPAATVSQTLRAGLARRQPRPPLAGCCARIQQPHGRRTHAPSMEHHHGYSITGKSVMMESEGLTKGGVRVYGTAVVTRRSKH